MTELRVTVPDDVAERLASEAALRGTSAEALAADLLRRHVAPANNGSLSFVGMFDAPEHGISVSEAERQLEDGDDNGFAQRSPPSTDATSRSSGRTMLTPLSSSRKSL